MALKKIRTLRSIKTNPGLRASYRREMQTLIDEMCSDVIENVISAYDSQESRIIGDAKLGEFRNDRRTPIERIEQTISSLFKKWKSRWGRISNRVAQKHMYSVAQRVQSSRLNELREMGFVIRINPSRYTNERFIAMVKENATLLESIPEQYFDKVSTAVMRSVSSGMDRKQLQDELISTTGITEKRAKFIARDQITKATQSLAECTDRDLGLTEGIWIHVPGRKMSRKTHIAMNGKRFDLDRGLWDDQVRKWVKPAQLYLCCCEYRPIIPDTWRA